jgi:VWFA-related protein
MEDAESRFNCRGSHTKLLYPTAGVVGELKQKAMNQRTNKYCLTLTLVVFVLVQASAPSSMPEQFQEPDVVRISVRLVQVDGTVTDKNGHQVSDLNKDDFDLFVDGQRQKITNFAYIPAQVVAKPSPSSKQEKDRGVAQPVAPPVRLRQEQVRRTIALVVANVSYESLSGVKKALKRFVDEQMQPGDLVSIIRISDVAGVVQQFTADKRLLHLAIEGVRWNPLGDVGLNAISDERAQGSVDPDNDSANAKARAESFYHDVVGSSWLRSLNLIVRGLEGLPGRKSVVLFSDRIRLFGLGPENSGQENRKTMDAVHSITDRATRALIVFHTIDARGLQTLADGASMNADELPGIGTPARPDDSHSQNGPRYAASVAARSLNFWKDQEGLALLADETGGTFRQSSDVSNALSNVLGDQKGYYLIGYRPDEAEFKLENGRRAYHHVAVIVKRPDLRSHFRKGFFGTPDKVSPPTLETSGRQIVAALTSPFDASDIGVKLTSLFGFDKNEGSFVRSLLHIDARSLTFAAEDDGRSLALINVVAAAFDENGLLADPVAQKYTVQVRDVQQVMMDGLTYELMTPVKRTGIYQLRVAVQDADSGRIGSASQFIEVPDVASKRLTLTGLVSLARNSKDSRSASSVLASDSEEVRYTPGEADARPAVRRFRVGMQMEYTFIVLNALVSPTSSRPQLDTQVVLYREGKAVFKGALRRLETDNKTNLRQIVVGGTVNLGAELTPGEYALQVIVTDNLAKEKKYRTATRWIDFDLVQPY